MSGYNHQYWQHQQEPAGIQEMYNASPPSSFQDNNNEPPYEGASAVSSANSKMYSISPTQGLQTANSQLFNTSPTHSIHDYENAHLYNTSPTQSVQDGNPVHVFNTSPTHSYHGSGMTIYGGANRIPTSTISVYAGAVSNNKIAKGKPYD